MIEFPNEECKWAWLAGLMDADSYIDLNKKKYYGKGKYPPRRGFGWDIRISFRQTSRGLIEQVKHVFKTGSVRIDKKRRKTPIYQIDICKRKPILLALEKTLPFLIKKKEQARLIIEAHDLLQDHYKYHTPHDERLEEIHQKIRELHD